jgi:2-polyprenyl-3-methyl-5-hydroxy-6-metoxy-1,4-benzoquinol methylase
MGIQGLSPAYLKLLSRIQRLVPIEHTSTRIAGTVYPWTKVVDPDALLLHALSESEEGTVELDPFWAASWRAAEGLDKYLGSLGSIGQSRVLELGGGSGRAGISAGLRGAQVVITDAVPTALLVCRFNARQVDNRVTIRRLDWRDRHSHLGRFPVIIGSDIVYDPKLFPVLEPCLRRHIEPGGSVYLSEPHRHTGDRFEPWIQAAGWLCESEQVDLGDGERAIRIFHCRLA